MSSFSAAAAMSGGRVAGQRSVESGVASPKMARYCSLEASSTPSGPTSAAAIRWLPGAGSNSRPDSSTQTSISGPQSIAQLSAPVLRNRTVTTLSDSATGNRISAADRRLRRETGHQPAAARHR